MADTRLTSSQVRGRIFSTAYRLPQHQLTQALTQHGLPTEGSARARATRLAWALYPYPDREVVQ